MPKGLVAQVARTGRSAEARNARVRLLVDADHYDALIQSELPRALASAWIGTANLKELRVEAPIGTRARARGRYVSILETLESLVNRDVEVRVLHGRPPSRAIAAELARHRGLREALGLRECPRVHLKVIAVDGRALYLGSANFTGAGLGARAESRRNFELGILTDDEHLLDVVQARFDAIWSGRECAACGLRRECPKPIDTYAGGAAAAPVKPRARPRRKA